MIGDPLDAETQMGSLISTAHREKVHGFVEGAREDGAEVVLGGQIPTEPPAAFYPPTVVAGVDNTRRDRAGGGLRPGRDDHPVRGRGRRGADSERRQVRADGDGLDAGPARGHRLASRIKAGTVGINMPYTAFPGLPFGGYKQSGFGRELGLETLELYLETKSVLLNTGSRPINPFGL